MTGTIVNLTSKSIMNANRAPECDGMSGRGEQDPIDSTTTAPSRLTRVLLACGAVGPPLFVVAFLILGATRPDYNPLRHPVSSLAIGGSGWIQGANFVLTGLLILAFAFGLRSALRRYGGGLWGALLIGLLGVGLIGSGFFVTDPISGYPPGTPVMPEPTTHGTLHDAFAIPVFLGLPIACLVVAYRFARSGHRAWAGYSVATAAAFLTGFVVTSSGFAQDPTLMPIGGALQRITIIIGLAWLTALALYLLRQTDRGQ